MDLNQAFAKAQLDVKTLTEKPAPSDLLALYALFKQACVGKNLEDEPGAFDFVAKAKYEAWQKLGDMSQDAAKQGYIDKVSALLAA